MQSNTHIVIVIIYVDDLIILASNMTKLMKFKAKLEKEFDMSDLEELHFFLGCKLRRIGLPTSSLCTKRATLSVISHFSMEYKPLATPLDAKATLVNFDATTTNTAILL